jgi:hypothetical protein
LEKRLREAVKILNRSFQCIPILYGSYAVEKILRTQVDAHDIDLLIEPKILERKPELTGAFEEAGFEYLHDDPLAFGKAGIEIELADREKWFGLCGFSSEGLLIRKGFDFRYVLLDAGNLAKLYRFLIRDPLRLEPKKRKDEIILGLLVKR